MSEKPYRPYFGWLAPVVIWLPALLLLGLGVPSFFELFDQLYERGELPAFTSGLLMAAKISRLLLHFPVAVFLVALIASDVAVADFAQGHRAPWVHQLWQAVAGVSGMVAAFIIVIGLLLPITGSARV